MGAFIARQPNGLLCRHSTIVDCVTDYNMTDEDFINLCVDRAKQEAQHILERNVRTFDAVLEALYPANMTESEFVKIVEEMSKPQEYCTYTTT